MISIKPLHDLVVIARLEEGPTTAGGIIIPENLRPKPLRGLVVAVGPGKRNKWGKIIPMQVTVGDIVLYGKFSGWELKVGGDTIFIMHEDEIGMHWRS